MKSLKVFMVLFLSLMCMNGTFSQDRFSFDLRAGYSIPTEDLGTVELDNGIGFDVDIGYRFLPHLSGYLGWGCTDFDTDIPTAGKLQFMETGYMFGLEFNHPIIGEHTSLYARGGAIYNHVEIENDAGDIIYDTEHGWGLQSSVGIDFGIGSGFHIIPNIKFQSLKREYGTYTGPEEQTFRYISLGISARKTF